MKDIICWWSGGVTSAVACRLALDIWGSDRCRIIMIDTKNEHPDTYRFKEELEKKYYGIEIEVITAIGDTYDSIQDVWYKHKQLNTANGAVCSYMLKRRVREKWEKENTFSAQVFGFEFEKKEFNRAMALKLNHPHTNPKFPLLMYGCDKDYCIKEFERLNIKLPAPYRMGFNNNNCLQTGCISGGIGYWQKIQRELPELFEKMAKIEHDLTDERGYPVTMVKDQSKNAGDKSKKENLVFLKPHKDYPNNKSIDQMKGREPKPLTECNGFCGVDELNPRNNTENELAL